MVEGLIHILQNIMKHTITATVATIKLMLQCIYLVIFSNVLFELGRMLCDDRKTG